MSTAVIIEKHLVSTESHKPSVVRLPRPVPKANEALVKIDAVSLNHRELWILKNEFPGIVFNSVLGADGVGKIIELNGESSRLKVGDRVVIMPSYGWISNPGGPEVESEYAIRGGTKSNGVFAQHFAGDQDDIFKAPVHLTDVEAGALPLAGLTAYRALFTRGHISKGQKVLITGIGGGVSLIALKFAVAIGADVYVSSSDDTKIKRAIKMGAKGGVNYLKESWHEELLKLTDGSQFELVVDGANGPNASIILNKVLAQGGAFVIYGQTAGTFSIDIHTILRNVSIVASTMGSRVEFEKMLQFVEKHKIRPVVSEVWEGLENIPKALQAMADGVQFGKLVLTVNGHNE